MRVLILSESTNIGEIGGGEIFNYHLLKTLYNRNYQTLLFSDKKFKKTLFNRVVLAHHKTYVFESLMLSSNEVVRFFSIFFSILKIMKYTFIFRPNIIFTNIDVALPIAYFIHVIFRIPIIFYKASIHIGYDLLALPSSPKIYALIEKILLKCLHLNLIITCSEHFSKTYNKIGGSSKCITLPIGCDLNLFKPISEVKMIKYRKKLGIDTNAKVIIFVGRLIREKGVFDLLRAFKLVVENETNAVLLLVGGGSLPNEIKSYIKSNNLSSQIKQLGVVSHNKLPSLLQVSDIFALPSYNETYGRSMIEAMACGKSVVGTLIPAFEDLEINGQAGILVPDNNYLALAKALKTVLQNNRLRHLYEQKALEIAQKHSFCDWSSKMVSIIKKNSNL